MNTTLLPKLSFAVTCLFWFAMDMYAQTIEPPSDAAMKRAADFSKAGKGQTLVVMFDGNIARGLFRRNQAEPGLWPDMVA